MAELADALVSGTRARKGVQVQVLFPAPQTVRKPAILAGFRHVLALFQSTFTKTAAEISISQEMIKKQPTWLLSIFVLLPY